MAIWKLTTKVKRLCGGQVVEKGMTAEVVHNSNPLLSTQGKQKTVDAFKSKYGIDMEKANCLSTMYYDIEDIK